MCNGKIMLHLMKVPPPQKKGILKAGTLTNQLKCIHFERAFAKLQKANVSFVMSVRPSVFSHGINSAPTQRIFMKSNI